MRIGLFVAGLAGLCLSGSVAAEDPIDAAWLARLRAEGRPAYDRHVALFGHLEEISETRYEHGKRPDQPQKADATHFRRVARSGPNTIDQRRKEFDGAKDPAPTILQGENRDYQFKLARFRDGPYSLMNYNLNPVHRVSDGARGQCWYAVTDFDAALDAAEGKPNHTLLGVRYDSTRKLVRVNSSQVFPSHGDQTGTHEIWVDPARHWHVVEVTAGSSLSRFTRHITYGPAVEGLDLPATVVEAVQYNNPELPSILTTTSRVEKVGPARLTDADFRLSAFGLPEPADAPPFEATDVRLHLADRRRRTVRLVGHRFPTPPLAAG